MASYNCEDPGDLRRFMQDFYPDYQDNLELAKILCRKYAEKRKSKRARAASRVKIGELREGMIATIEGVVSDVDVFSYLGCPDKRKTGCRESEKREWIVSKAYVEDETGGVWVMVISDSKLDVDAGYIVAARGRVKKYKDRLELALYDLEVKAKPAKPLSDTRAEPAAEPVGFKSSSDADGCVGEFLDLVKEVGEIDYDAFARGLKRKCGVEDADAVIEKHGLAVEKDRYGRVFIVWRGGSEQ